MDRVLKNPYGLPGAFLTNFLYKKPIQYLKDIFLEAKLSYRDLLILTVVTGIFEVLLFAGTSGLPYLGAIGLQFFLILNLAIVRHMVSLQNKNKYESLAGFYFWRRWDQIVLDIVDIFIVGALILSSYSKTEFPHHWIVILGIILIVVNFMLQYVGVINLLIAPRFLGEQIISDLDKQYFNSAQILPFGRDVQYIILSVGIFLFSIEYLFITLIITGLLMFVIQNMIFIKKITIEEKISGKPQLGMAWESLKDKSLEKVEGIYAHYNKILAFKMVPFWDKKGMTPNQTTVLAFFIGLCACAFYAMPYYFAWIIGAILVFISFLFDGIDGTLARLKGKTTYFGGWIDKVLDKTGDVFLIISIGIGHYLRYEDMSVWILIFLAVGTYLIYCRACGTLIIGKSLTKNYSPVKHMRIYEWFLEHKLLFGFRRDICLFVIMFFSLFDDILWALFFIIIGQSIEWITKSYDLSRRRYFFLMREDVE